MKQKIKTDWHIKHEDFGSVIDRYTRYLMGRGFSESSIERYAIILRNFLMFAGDSHPDQSVGLDFRDHIMDMNQAKSTINNSCYALNNFYKMHGEIFEFPILRVSNTIPYYFTEDDVHKIFDAASRNIKHLAMLQTLFYGCLRATEMCRLEDKDIDLKNLTIRVRHGKGDKEGIVLITPQCAKTLHKYLEVRPDLCIDGRSFLFFTDYGKQWNRVALHRMFVLTKKRAHVDRPGGVHVFGRHSPATLMIAHGADVRVVQTILGHNDIKTTLRYTHVSDSTKRTMYDKFLHV